MVCAMGLAAWRRLPTLFKWIFFQLDDYRILERNATAATSASV